MRPRTTRGPSGNAIIPVPSIGTRVQPWYSREPWGFCWFVSGGCFVEKGEELFSSIDGAKKVKDGWARAPVVDVGLIACSQEERAVENYVGERALF